MLSDLSPADHLPALPLDAPQPPGSGATHDPSIGEAADAVTWRFGTDALAYGAAGLHPSTRLSAYLPFEQSLARRLPIWGFPVSSRAWCGHGGRTRSCAA